MVDQIGRLLRQSDVCPRGGGSRHLVGFLAHLVADSRWVVEQLDRVGAGRAGSLAVEDRALQDGRRLVDGGCGLILHALLFGGGDVQTSMEA